MKTNMKRIAVVLAALLLCSVVPSQALDINVTQATSTTTAVTANGESGVITTFTHSDVAGASAAFTVNNTGVRASSGVLVSIIGYSGTLVTNGIPIVTVTSVAAGSFVINVTNVAPTNALSGTLVITFKVI